MVYYKSVYYNKKETSIHCINREKKNNKTWLSQSSPEKQSVGYILWRIYKNWFTWFWRLKSLMICYPKGGKPGKVKI